MSQDYPKHDYCMEKEGLHNICKFDVTKKDQECPHWSEKRDFQKKIKDNITDCVGNTPLVRINNITKKDGIECEVLAKCEFLNPGGSVKDRIGRRMIIDAQTNGRIKPGDILVEPTSGNTGIGLSMTGAALGYRVIITMPEKMSVEKRAVLSGLGAEIVRTPNEYAFDHRYSHIGIADNFTKTLPNCFMLDQYKALGNPMAHFEETGQEIWDCCEGKLDYVFLGAGTVGTLTGVSRKLKMMDPNIKIIALDPHGSDLAEPASLNNDKPAQGYQIEGIGYDFNPRVCDKTLVDEWIKTSDGPSFPMSRRLIREEGLLCGGSSGTAMHYALEYIKEHKIGKDKRCVVILPDGVRNYMTKFLNNDWMYENGFITEEECVKLNSTTLVENTDWGTKYTVADLPMKESPKLNTNTKLHEAISSMNEHNQDCMPIVDANGDIVGLVTVQHLMERFTKNKLTMDDPIGKFALRDYRKVSLTIQLSELSRIFTRLQYVLVDGKYIVQQRDLLNFMMSKEKTNAAAEPKEETIKEDDQDAEQEENPNNKGKICVFAGIAAAAAVATVFSMQKN